jgi:LysM repeat protein
VSSTRDRDRERERERERAAAAAAGHLDGPVWERQRRLEAYPQIKTRVGMPSVPRVAVLAVALAVAAIALFFLPALLGIGGDDDEPGASPTRSAAAATATPDPTPVPAPTPQVYVIKAGDTLSKIAREFGLTVEQLLAANEETIEDPDRIVVGDEIIIPLPPADEVDGGSPGASAEP